MVSVDTRADTALFVSDSPLLFIHISTISLVGFFFVTAQRSRMDLTQINSLIWVFFLDADGPNSQSMAAVIGRQDCLCQCILHGVEILSKQCLFILKCRQRQKYHQCANCAKPTVGWVLEARQYDCTS